MSSPGASVDFSYRLGASVLASAAGSVLGLFFGCVLVYLGTPVSIASAIAIGAGAGVASGFVFPVGAMDFAEGTIHFLVGFFREGASSVVDEDSSVIYQGNPQSPEWLRWSFLYGALFAGALSLVASL